MTGSYEGLRVTVVCHFDLFDFHLYVPSHYLFLGTIPHFLALIICALFVSIISAATYPSSPITALIAIINDIVPAISPPRG